MPAKYLPPYYGAAYYPEDWPLEQIDADIALMKEAGMNVMRIGEFAWADMEPEEGKYTFDWLHTVVDKLDAAGIGTIMGTPSATPPAWLTAKYPEVLFVTPTGKQAGHGGRRHTCPNSPVYRDHCARITRKMAEEFGAHAAIVGWQIDNEVATHYDFGSQGGSFFSRACCCPVCMESFQTFMRERYGTIEALNKAWCLSLWSQKYDDFAQLPAPSPAIWHHPALLAAWSEFSSRSYVAFVKDQADILHDMTDGVPIGTDMMPFLEYDHYDMHRALDVVQYNFYYYHDNFRNAPFWFDFLRPIGKPIWNTECSTGWSGSIATSGYSEPGFCRANSWLNIALGGEATLYWLWRTHWAGQELTHGSVVNSQGRPLHNFPEVQSISKGFGDCAAFINGTKPTKTGLAIHLSHLSHTIISTQPHQHGLQYDATVRDKVYRPLVKQQWRPDVIDTSVALDGYNLIVSSLTPSLEHHGLRDRLKAWIEAGGTWVAGPLTDIRNADGSKYAHSPFGVLEEWGGVYCKFSVPGQPRTFKVKWDDGTEGEGGVYYDAFELRGAEALATYTENELAGMAAVTCMPMGKGRVVVLGTALDEAGMAGLVARLGADAGVAPVAKASENLLVVPRDGGGMQGLMLIELYGEEACIELPKAGTNLLTGEAVSGEMKLPPFGVAVVQYA